MPIEKDPHEKKIYDATKKKLNDEIDFLKSQTTRKENHGRNDSLELEMFIDMLDHAKDYYERADYVQKGKIAQILFLHIKIYPKKRLLVQPKADLETLFTRQWWS
jgi:hypothetical protein